jgi:hypothetical protein
MFDQENGSDNSQLWLGVGIGAAGTVLATGIAGYLAYRKVKRQMKALGLGIAGASKSSEPTIEVLKKQA